MSYLVVGKSQDPFLKTGQGFAEHLPGTGHCAGYLTWLIPMTPSGRPAMRTLLSSFTDVQSGHGLSQSHTASWQRSPEPVLLQSPHAAEDRQVPSLCLLGVQSPTTGELCQSRLEECLGLMQAAKERSQARDRTPPLNRSGDHHPGLTRSRPARSLSRAQPSAPKWASGVQSRGARETESCSQRDRHFRASTACQRLWPRLPAQEAGRGIHSQAPSFLE